ncbi:hypothetical protein PN477_10095, partial [Spirulina subsalsa CS-330]
ISHSASLTSLGYPCLGIFCSLAFYPLFPSFEAFTPSSLSFLHRYPLDGRVPILIEIKNEKEVGILEQSLNKKLAHYSGEYAIQSFNPFTVCWFTKNAPHVIRGQLSGGFKSGNSAWYKKLLFRNLLMNWVSAPQFIGYDIKALPYAPISIARNIFKVPILAWTIKNEQEKQKALKYADNFIFESIKL